MDAMDQLDRHEIGNHVSQQELDGYFAVTRPTSKQQLVIIL